MQSPIGAIAAIVGEQGVLGWYEPPEPESARQNFGMK